MQSGPNEVWSSSDEAYVIIKEFLFLRERLRLYIMTRMPLVQTKSIPLMRLLLLEFPGDPECWNVGDAFMFGLALFVAPVVHQGVRSRSAYSPAGTTWVDVWTGRMLDGGQWITADAPLERIPLFLRGEARPPIREG